MLKVRALVISPKENMEMWIKFANLCRKSGRIGLAEKSLNSLLDSEGNRETGQHDISGPPQVVYARLKYIWATNHQEEALMRLAEFTEKLSQEIGPDANQPRTSSTQGINPNLSSHA